MQCIGESSFCADDGRHAASEVAGDVRVRDLSILEEKANEFAAAGNRPVVEFVHDQFESLRMYFPRASGFPKCNCEGELKMAPRVSREETPEREQ